MEYDDMKEGRYSVSMDTITKKITINKGSSVLITMDKNESRFIADAIINLWAGEAFCATRKIHDHDNTLGENFN